jgi:hypothetical protein
MIVGIIKLIVNPKIRIIGTNFFGYKKNPQNKKTIIEVSRNLGCTKLFSDKSEAAEISCHENNFFLEAREADIKRPRTIKNIESDRSSYPIAIVFSAIVGFSVRTKIIGITNFFSDVLFI